MTQRRRDFLYAMASAACLPQAAYAQAAPSTTRLTDRVSLISGAGNNVVVLASDAGRLLVDCGDAAHAQDVLRLAGGRVARVYNTHWHLEATGGNDTMARAGATLAAHLNTQLWMTQEIVHEWANRTYAPRAKQAQPAETFTAGGRAGFGGETIEYGPLPLAHTDGDIFVHFLDSDVLAVGDAVQPGRFPTLDWFCGGWIGGMQAAHRTILERASGATKIVPGSGPVMTKAEVQASLDVLTKVREELVKLMKQGKGAQDWIDAKAVDSFRGQWAGDPDLFLYLAYRGLWAHARELGGIV